MTLIPLERKELILKDAKKRILLNHTLEEIAVSRNITKRTLNTWLMSLGEEYQELRRLWIDNKLADAKEAIEEATEDFPLSRARERWRAVTWYAERRDPMRYGGAKVNINVAGSVTMSEALDTKAGELLDQIAKE